MERGKKMISLPPSQSAPYEDRSVTGSSRQAHGPERIDRANARSKLAKGSLDKKDVHELAGRRVRADKGMVGSYIGTEDDPSAGPASLRLFGRERSGGRY